MRGQDVTQSLIFSYRTLAERIPESHPLRKLRAVVDEILLSMDDAFTAAYSRTGQGSFGMRVETVSNHYLSDGERLDRKLMSALRKIGWKAPTNSARQSTPERDPDGSPNYHVDFPAPVPTDQIAVLTVATFAEIHGVPYPGMLDYEAFDDEGNSCLLYTSGQHAIQ